MTIEDLDNKFNALSDRLLTPDRQSQIKELIFNCEKTNADDFMRKLVV